MQVPSAHSLLQAWERGRAAPRRAEQALALLAAACDDVPHTTLARLPIGERDGLLLAMRQRIFGACLHAVTACPGCGTRLEMELSTDDLDARGGESRPKPDAEVALSVVEGDYEITCRLPNSEDLAILCPADSVDENRRRLIARVVLRAVRRDEAISAADLPNAVLDVLEDRLAEADPQGDVRLNLACAACGRSWQAPFDIVSFLTSEVDAWANRQLREVHLLARAYGWREADILALSPWRRHRYLDLLGQ